MSLDNNVRMIVRTCNGCLEERLKMLKCSGCGVAHYCSSQCQKDNWSKHRTICLELRKIREHRETLCELSKQLKRTHIRSELNKEQYDLIIVEKEEEIVSNWQTRPFFDRIDEPIVDSSEGLIMIPTEDIKAATISKTDFRTHYHCYDLYSLKFHVQSLLNGYPSIAQMTVERLEIIKKMAPFVDVLLIYFKPSRLLVFRTMARNGIKVPKRLQPSIETFSFVYFDQSDQ